MKKGLTHIFITNRRYDARRDRLYSMFLEREPPEKPVLRFSKNMAEFVERVYVIGAEMMKPSQRYPVLEFSWEPPYSVRTYKGRTETTDKLTSEEQTAFLDGIQEYYKIVEERFKHLAELEEAVQEVEDRVLPLLE